MSDSRVSGTAKQAYGQAQEAAGDLIGDAKTQAKGALNQARGQAEDLTGQLVDAVREQPITAVLIGVGIGYIMGRLRLL